MPLGYLKSESCTWHQADRRMKFSDNYSSDVHLVISVVVFQTVGRGGQESNIKEKKRRGEPLEQVLRYITTEPGSGKKIRPRIRKHQKVKLSSVINPRRKRNQLRGEEQLLRVEKIQ